ncbi:MAG: hypothetical protein ACE5OZ_22675 [Candidatus Heimdallarchaeota archaeon]
MVTTRAALLLDHSAESLSKFPLPAANFSIRIRQGREEPCLLQAIDYLTHTGDSFGIPFQPCLEDLQFLFGEDYERTALAIEALQRKGLAESSGSDFTPDNPALSESLALSSKGVKMLQSLRKDGNSDMTEEWEQIRPRLDRLLEFPRIHVFDQPEVTFFQIREVIRLIARVLPPISSISNEIIFQFVASEKNKTRGPKEIYQRVIGFIDVLLRLQGDYIPYDSLVKIARLLEKHGIALDLSKKFIYSHIRHFVEFFGINQVSEEVLFNKATLKALSYYCMQFRIEKQVKDQIVDLHTQLAPINQAARDDPEAWAIGLLGTIIQGFFRIENHEKFPLAPGVWLAGKEMRQHIQKLLMQQAWRERAKKKEKGR